MVTGCTSSKETKEKQEEIKVVYCSDCGDESNEVTKFCSGCGVEAKWISKKPKKIDKENTKETENKETINEEIDKNNIKKEESKNEETSEELNKEEKELTYCSICNVDTDIWSLNNSEYGLICNEFKIDTSEFTGEEAISIAEDYYGIKNHPNDFISIDLEPQYDNRGMYYRMWAKSKEMIEQGGNGIIFSFKTYEDGTIVEE